MMDLIEGRMEVKHVSIAVDKIHPNPHRSYERNPIREDQVAKLVDSIERTGFWDNVVVRPYPGRKGEYQLAYGHNRLEAAKRSKLTEIRVGVADFLDHQMW